MEKILRPFSYLFHPIFIPVFGTLAYLHWGDNYFEPFQQLLLLAQVVIIMVLIPISFFYLFKTFGIVDSIMLSDLSQRKIPLLTQALLIGVLVWQTVSIDRTNGLFFFFVGGLATTIFLLIALFCHIKASIHMAGMGTLTVFLIALSLHYQINLMTPIALLIFMNGIVAASRLSMQAHDFKELVIGFLCGTIPSIALWYCWL